MGWYKKVWHTVKKTHKQVWHTVKKINKSIRQSPPEEPHMESEQQDLTCPKCGYKFPDPNNQPTPVPIIPCCPKCGHEFQKTEK